MFNRFLVLFGILCLFSFTSYANADSEKKGDFRFFDGVWTISSGPLAGAGLELVLGKWVSFPNLEFALIKGGQVFRSSNSFKLKHTKVSGRFFRPSVPIEDDLASAAGLGEEGTYNFELKPNSVHELSGEFISSDGSRIPVEAFANELTFNRTAIVLSIKAAKRKQYRVGELVTFKVRAEVRGPAGVSSEQPLLEIAVSNEVTQAEVVRTKNISACRVILTNTVSPGIFCDFSALGPKQVVAEVDFRVKVPENLRSKVLSVGVGVIEEEDPDAGQFIIEVQAAPRVARVKIKKSSSTCGFLAGQWTTNVGSLSLLTDGTYSAVENGLNSSGLWTCEVVEDSTYLRLGLETSTGPFYPERYLVSADGRHFEGYNSFGFFFSGDKI